MSRPISIHKKFLIGSICISIALHLFEIKFLQRQALWFSTPASQEIHEDDWISSIEKKERDQFLKEAFGTPASSRTESSSKEESTPAKIRTDPIPIAHKDLVEKLAQKISLEHPAQVAHFSKTLFPETPLHSSNLTVSFETPLHEKISLLSTLPKGIIHPNEPLPSSSKTELPDLLANQIHIMENLPKETIEIPARTRILPEIKTTHSSWEPKHFAPKALAAPLLPLMPKIPSLSDLKAAPFSSSFDTDLVFFEMESGKYLFALTLIPHEDLNLPLLKQNYIFLIDRSNSIQKERLNATKSAVRKAIDELQESDQFNVIVFDQKIDKLAPTMLPASSGSLAKAHDFLNKIELGSFFSQKNLYKPLFLTLPHQSSTDELYTAILITDGESLSQKSTMQSLMSDWTRLNHGKVSLYTLGMNDDLHLDLLSTISNLNRGKAISSPTNRGLKRKLLKLMKTIQKPVAKNLSCKAIARNVQGEIELFPKTSSAPHLFRDEPYVILGTANSLEDFVIFVQGRLNGQWLHIKKNVSFTEAKKGNAAMKSEWAQLKAFALYEQYLEGAGNQYLTEAKDLLKSFELPEIFESIQ